MVRHDKSAAQDAPTVATTAAPGSPILDTMLPGGASFSRVCRRGTALTLIDVDGGANVSALLYRAGDPLERYCMPDTLKAQHTSQLAGGLALYSDMGRVLASIVDDTCGWHDTICGHATDELVAARWGTASYQESRNGWRRSARQAFLVELAKHGLGPRDVVANVNFFSKVAVDADGGLVFTPGNSRAGDYVTLRFELDTLVVLSSGPHPLDPIDDWAPRLVRLQLVHVAPAAVDDTVRCACPENARGFAATEAVLV
jgi:urea carboxylase-associated protein 2